MGVTTRHTRRILAAYRELGAAAVAHSKPSPQLITRVGRGRSIFNELNRPMDLALVREYQEPAEVYEKRPARRRVPGIHRNNVSDLLRLVSTRCSGASARAAVSINPTICMRFEADHIVTRSDGGDNERRNVQLLCGYCNRVKGTQGSCGHRLKMPELRGGQRGHEGDGGPATGGDHRPPAGPASLGEPGAMTPRDPHLSLEEEHVRQIQPDSGPAGAGRKVWL